MKRGFVTQLALLSMTVVVAFGCQGNSRQREKIVPKEHADDTTASLTPQVKVVNYNAPTDVSGTSSCTARPGSAMSEKEHSMMKRMPTDKTPTVNGQPIQPAPQPAHKQPTSAMMEEEQSTAQMIEEESVVAEIEVFANHEEII